MKKQNPLWTTMEIGALVIILAIAPFWIWHPAQSQVPSELVGEWRTVDPNYADRAFTLTQSTINFGTGEGQVAIGFIRAVKSVPSGNRTQFTIDYSLDGSPNEISFFYENGKDKTIRMKNQEKTIWRRESED